MGVVRRPNVTLFLVIFFTAVAFAGVGLWIEPPGEIHTSVLILVAQILVLAASVYGFGMHIDLKGGKVDAGPEVKDEEKKESE